LKIAWQTASDFHAWICHGHFVFFFRERKLRFAVSFGFSCEYPPIFRIE